YAVEHWLRSHVPAGTTIEIAGNPHYQARIPHTLAVVYARPDSLRLAPRAPIGEIVLTSSVDRYAYERAPIVRRVWFESLLDPGRYMRLRFPRPRNGRLWDFEIPDIDVYVRAGSPITKTAGAP